MEVKLPNLFFKTKVYGIEVEVYNQYESSGTTLHVKSKFYVKRAGILKRWDAIVSNLPDLVDIRLTGIRHRTVKRTEKPIVNDTGSFICFGPNAEYKADKRKGKYGQNLINEYVEVTMIRPLLFTNNLHAEAERAVRIRELIYAENTRLKAIDRINLVMGNAVTPEWEEEKLTRLLYLRKGEPINPIHGSTAW